MYPFPLWGTIHHLYGILMDTVIPAPVLGGLVTVPKAVHKMVGAL